MTALVGQNERGKDRQHIGTTVELSRDAMVDDLDRPAPMKESLARLKRSEER